MTIKPLPRITSATAFERDHLAKAQPAVIVGAAQELAAYSKWSDEYLLQLHGDAKVTVRFTDRSEANIRFADYWAYYKQPSNFQSTRGPAYLSDYFIWPTTGHPILAALGNDVRCPLQRGPGPFAEWMSIFAGPAGSRTRLHTDVFGTHSWLALLRGTKRWRLCAPAFVASEHAHKTSLFDDTFAHDVFDAVVEQGDLVYIPPNWWHEVENVTPTLAVSSNFCTLAAAVSHLQTCQADVTMEGRDVWIKTWTAVVAAQQSSQPV